MPTPLNIIYTWFETDDFPTEMQFKRTFSSFWHKDDFIPTASIQGLENLLNGKVSNDTFNAHLTDADAHATNLAKVNASNINPDNVVIWQTLLELMKLSEWTENGLIKAAKIPPQAISSIIDSVETTLADFVTNVNNYEFEKHDIIAIPDGNGMFALFIYNGIDKAVESNYYPTGLSNITVAMVQGLQDALDNLQAGIDAKLDIPVSLTSTSIPLWNVGTSNFTPSEVYQHANGNIGIGTTNPTEKFEVSGWVKGYGFAYVTQTSNVIPNKTWTNGTDLFFTNGSGISKKLKTSSIFMYTPSGNFLMSTVKSAAEAAGVVFEDIHLIIQTYGSTFQVTLDLPAEENVISVVKRGTGILDFIAGSGRTITAVGNISSLMGGPGSICLLETTGTNIYLNIANY